MTLPTRRPGRPLTLLRTGADATAAIPAAHWPTQPAASLSEAAATWAKFAQLGAERSLIARSRNVQRLVGGPTQGAPR